MPQQDVFLEKKYYINESTPDGISYPTDWYKNLLTSGSAYNGGDPLGYGRNQNTALNPKWDSSCTYISTNLINSSITTAIPQNSANLQNGKLNTTALNILEVYEYITLLVNNFSRDYSLATSCDIGSRYEVTTGGFTGGCCKNNNKNADMQPSCNIFANFTDTEYKPHFGQTGDYNSYKRLNINEFIYKDSSCKRSLCQQFDDINSLVNSFKTIVLTDIKNQGITPTTTSPTQINDIKKQHSQMIELRNKLDLQLQRLMNKGSIFAENKLQLDSTVYTTVLWTVLATSVLYYVFIKI